MIVVMSDREHDSCCVCLRTDRVAGSIAMSRALGNSHLKQFLIGDPDVLVCPYLLNPVSRCRSVGFHAVLICRTAS